jgi:hypothetical protein
MGDTSKWKAAICILVAVCLAVTQLEVSAFAESSKTLSIALAERDRQEIVVQVLNGDAPAAGVDVMFSLPSNGPGGQFTNGARRMSVRTDAKGRARSASIRPNAISGEYQVAVIASLAGATSAQVAVPQANPPAQTPEPPRSRNLKWVLLGVAAAGAIVAAIVLMRDEDPEPVVTVGAPTVGSPQ